MAERLELLISERRIRARTAALARRIDDDYRGKQLSLVIVLKGAVLFAADLMRHITIPCTIDFVAAASYGEGSAGAWITPSATAICAASTGSFSPAIRCCLTDAPIELRR